MGMERTGTDIFIRAFQDRTRTLLLVAIMPFEAGKTRIIEPVFYKLGANVFP
jgi:chromosome condensin MukBEF MukE localization factor